jgi:hypothetical protein
MGFGGKVSLEIFRIFFSRTRKIEAKKELNIGTGRETQILASSSSSRRQTHECRANRGADWLRNKPEPESIHNFLLLFAPLLGSKPGLFVSLFFARFNFQFCWSSALFSISSLRSTTLAGEFSNLELPRKRAEQSKRLAIAKRRKKITFTSIRRVRDSRYGFCKILFRV